jgi:DNA-directed RNA polymerase specialized sigma24 family protein
MKSILELVSEKHNVWIKYVISFGCDKETAEDYVQDMYLKIHAYIQNGKYDLMYNDNEINFYFIYVTLKNMYYDNTRKNSKYDIIEIDSYDFVDDIMYSETDFNLRMQKLKKWELNIVNQINEIEDYTREKANLCYILFIYEKILVENMSITELSKKAGISYWSLRNTIQIIKQQIKNEI